MGSRKVGMAASWEIRDRILIVTAIGDWSDGGPPAAVDQAITDPRFKPGMSLLLDVRQSTMNLSADEVRLRSKGLALLGTKGLSSRCAIVVGPKLFQYGLARMAKVFLEHRGMELEIFRDLDAALEWLSLASTPEPTTG